MNEEAILQRSQLLLQQGRTEQAGLELRRLLAANPNHSVAHALLALTLLGDADELPEAQREAERAIHLDPTNSFGYYTLSIALERQSRTDDAIQAIKEALRIDPGDDDYHASLASLLSMKSDWKGALESAERGLAIDPDNDRCGALRSLALERLGRTGDAVEEAVRAVQRNPDSSYAHSAHGWALIRAGRVRESQTAFREALRLEPTNEFARTGMIEALNSDRLIFRLFNGLRVKLSRLDARVQMGVILGFWIFVRILNSVARDNPGLKPYVLPISVAYLVLAMLSWMIDPLFNAFLRLHPFGKHLLSRKESTQATLVAGVVGIGCAGAVFRLVMADIAGAVLALLVPIMLSIPISIAFRTPNNWKRWTAIAVLVGLACIAVPLFIAVAADVNFVPEVFFAVYFLGILVLSFVGQALIQRSR